MKHFLTVVFSMKLNACLSFTAIMLVWALVEIFWGFPLLTGWRVVQLLVLSLICGALQYLVFERPAKLPYVGRVLLFGSGCLAAAALFAALFQWFPLEEPSYWLVFLVGFTVPFFALTLGFEIMFRITGRKYTDLLNSRQAGS